VAVALWAVVAHFRPVSEAETAASAERFCRLTSAAIDRDAATLQAIAEGLFASPEFAGIVDGGGTAVRPERLFSILTAALPRKGAGWGAVFFDAGGSAVAWGGEAGDLESERTPALAGFSASFHVTKLTLAYRLLRGDGPNQRGVLLISRRYPTGVLRPDLLDLLGIPGGPVRSRLLARAATDPKRLIAITVQASPATDTDDLRRARARVASVLSALLFLGVFVFEKRGSAIVAARLVLLLGVPRAETGAFREILPFGLVSTPADILLSGAAALLLARAVAPSERRSLPPVRSRFLPLLACAGVLLPVSLGFEIGRNVPRYFDDLGLVAESLAIFCVRAGAVGLATAVMLAVAAGLRGIRPRRAWSVPVGVALVSAGFLLPIANGALVALGTLTLGLALSSRLDRPDADLLHRAATAVLAMVVGSAALAGGLAAGKRTRLDEALARAEADERRSLAADDLDWQARLAGIPMSTFFPAGKETNPSDLARALWERGAGEGFPQAGEILELRDAATGESTSALSAFGVMRPGAEALAERFQSSIRVPGMVATWVRLRYPREADRDRLLSEVVFEDLPGWLAVERFESDEAGRTVGSSTDEQFELPETLRARARRRVTSTDLRVGDDLRRVRVRASAPGFVGFSVASDPPLVTLGSVAAAAEAALPLVLLALLAGRAGGFPSLSLATFRARLVALVLLFGALPLAGSVAIVRLAMERYSVGETTRRARSLLSESRRALESARTPVDHQQLNRVAGVVGGDLFVYHDGLLRFASRALPVAAGTVGQRLNPRVAQALAEGGGEAAAPGPPRGGASRIVEAAMKISRDGRDVLAVAVAEDEAGRAALDGLVLLTVAVALLGFGLGGRAALSLSRPIEDVIEGAERLGSGDLAPRIERPAAVDLARLVESFEKMADRVRDRTASLARERAAAVGLLANLTAAVILFRERDGAVLLANPAADDILPGDDLRSRLQDARWEPLRAALTEARRRGGPYETRITVEQTPKERVFRMVVASLPPDEGEARALLLLEDLTDFVRADRLSAWVEAARSIAHDVKNPLTPIRLATERLGRLNAKGETLPPGVVDSVTTTILRQVEILTDRIGKLSRFSALSSLQLVPVDREGLRRLLAEIAVDYRSDRGPVIEVHVSDDVPLVRIDRPLLRDALANLVVNAVEALGEVREGRIALRVEPFEHGARFVCEDNGPGVPDALRARLFEPSFSTKSRGSGMGLAAARRAIERQGGSVFASPRPEGGLVIGFALPGADR